MNEHDIQPEPRMQSSQAGEDAPFETVDIRRTGFLAPLHRAVLGLSFLACIVAVFGTVLFLGIVAFHGRREGWEFVVGFGIWDSLPYAVLTIPIWWFRRTLSASIAMLMGTLGIAGWGLFALHDGLSQYLNPLPPGVMCCFGPSVQYDLPVFQIVPVAGSWIVAAMLNRFENRKRNLLATAGGLAGGAEGEAVVRGG